MPNLSFWEKDTFFKNIDYAVIGSGIVGLNAAITFKEKYPKRKVVVLERGVLPIGASTRNAGFACFGSLTELIDDLSTQTEDTVLSLVEKRWRGLARLRERCGDDFLEYKAYGGMEIFREEETPIFEECRNKMPWFNDKIGQITGNKATYAQANERINSYGFDGVKNLIVNKEEGQIHTGNMMLRLLNIAKEKDVLILNGITITSLHETSQGVEIGTNQGWEILAGKALIATNGFASQLLPNTDIIPARNQVVITEPIPDLPFKGCFHYDCGYFYFRNIGNRVLLGGGRNLAKQEEETAQFGQTELIQNALHKLLKEVILPNSTFKIEQSWSGILGVGATKKPIIQKISDNVGVAIRLGGMGVAIGSLLGEEGANMMLGE